MDLETIRRTPKVLLHDHLDGGLRPATIVELAEDHGYDGLPTTDPEDLAEALHQGRGGVDLEGYLEAFAHTVGVTQTRDALTRVARECAEDHAADGVVYAEVRFAPELHTERGLELDEVVEAVLDGFRAGSEGTDLTIRAILTTLRTARHSHRVAETAVRWRDDGVVGFDIAGAEAGHPPTEHLEAFHYIQRENFHITIHAGEAYGLASIWKAIQYCGAERLGHGVRLVDDITDGPDGPQLGRLAAFVRDRRIALELCPTSNVHTGAVPSVEEHPFDLFARLGFRVTVNTDNRLMSGITLSDELAALQAAFGYGLDELETFAINGAKASFLPFDQRTSLIEDVITPRFEALRDGGR